MERRGGSREREKESWERNRGWLSRSRMEGKGKERGGEKKGGEGRVYILASAHRYTRIRRN